MNQVIFCSVGFLDALYKKINISLSEFLISEQKDLESIPQLYHLIHQTAIINTDEDIVEKSKTNPNYKKLFKQSKFPNITRDSFIKIKNQDKDFFSACFTNTIFLLDEDETCKKIENNFGFIAFSKDQMHQTKFLFHLGLELFEKGANKDWLFLEKYKHPFNSLIISDAYILCTSESKESLKQLLLNFLPKELKAFKFDLTIISDRNQKGLPDKLEITASELNDFLRQNFSYEINLTLVISKIHDRNFVTNYLWCSSGYGFELVKNGNARYNTHLAVIPITYMSQPFTGYKTIKVIESNNDSCNIVQCLLKEYSNVNNSKRLSATNVIGNKQNRLLNNTYN